MTTDQLNRRMAELDGWKWISQRGSVDGDGYWKHDKGTLPASGWVSVTEKDRLIPSYTTSFDAIRPVLEKMTDAALSHVTVVILGLRKNGEFTHIALLRATPLELCRAIVAVKGEKP